MDYNFYFRSSIIGGSAFIANNNAVSISNVRIDGISKKYGIVGGRAYDGTHVNKNTLYGCGADGNSIYISGSEIGLDNSLSGAGINIYAALSYGAATNNFAILENSVFNGNVYGAAAALGSLLDSDENGKNNTGSGQNDAVANGHNYNYTASSKTVEKGSLNNSQILYLFNKAPNQYEIRNGKAENNNKILSESNINEAFSNYWEGLSDTNTISLNNVALTQGSSVYASAGIFVPVNSDGYVIFNNAKVVT